MVDGLSLDVTFFANKAPYRQTGLVTLLSDHYGYGFPARDRRPVEEQDKNSFVLVFLAERASEDACRLYKFTRPSADEPWGSKPKQVDANHPNRVLTQVKTVEVLKGGIVFIAYGRLFKYLTPDLEVIKDQRLYKVRVGLE